MLKKVDDNINRSPRPKKLADIGDSKTLLDVESGLYEIFHGKLYEEDEFAEATGLKMFHVPMSDLMMPSRAALDRCLGIMENPVNWPVLVHCEHGEDRTGLVIAWYRVKHDKWPVEKAIQEMLDNGFHKYFYFWWIPMFRKLCAAPEVTHA